MHHAFVFLIGAHLIHQKVTVKAPPGTPAPPEQTSTLLWDGAKMRTDSGTDTSTIIDYKADKITMLDHKRKQYSEQKISEVLAQLKLTFEAMRAQMAQLPKEQRDAMEGVLGQKAELKLKPTDETQKIIGFEAKKFRLEQAGKESGEVWYSKAIDMKDVAPYTKRFGEMTRGMMGSSWADVLAKTEHGYPLRSVITLDVMGQKASYTTETTQYEKVKADPASFAPPADYAKVAAPQMPGAQPVTKPTK